LNFKINANHDTSKSLDEASAAHYSSNETLFSQYLYLTSPSSLFDGLGEHGGELRPTDVGVTVASPTTSTATLGLDENTSDG
jgi:hypothetical protein